MVAADSDQPTAFRAAEKRYQLHREQKIRIRWAMVVCAWCCTLLPDCSTLCSKGRKHGGKLVISPTDFSDVLDPRLHNTRSSELTLHHSQLLGKTVYSLSRHPGNTNCLC